MAGASITRCVDVMLVYIRNSHNKVIALLRLSDHGCMTTMQFRVAQMSSRPSDSAPCKLHIA